jgi:hypothetical protein
MKTGERVTDLALYVSECCGEELIFDRGDSFVRCPQCSSLCVWELEEEIISHDEFEDINGVVA